jgi:hypothetical protein
MGDYYVEYLFYKSKSEELNEEKIKLSNQINHLEKQLNQQDILLKNERLEMNRQKDYNKILASNIDSNDNLFKYMIFINQSLQKFNSKLRIDTSNYAEQLTSDFKLLLINQINNIVNIKLFGTMDVITSDNILNQYLESSENIMFLLKLYGQLFDLEMKLNVI